MFDSASQGHFLRGAGVRDQVLQRYISMLEGLIVNRWSVAEQSIMYFITDHGAAEAPPSCRSFAL